MKRFFSWLFPFRSASEVAEHVIVQQALSTLVARHPREYINLAAAEVALIPNGGSALPWRYRRQFLRALDRAERTLVLQNLDEWSEILSYLNASEEIKNATPEDFLR